MMSDVMFGGIMRLIQISFITVIFCWIGMIIMDIKADRDAEKKLRSSSRRTIKND